jgi:hypothetical protein
VILHKKELSNKHVAILNEEKIFPKKFAQYRKKKKRSGADKSIKKDINYVFKKNTLL